MAKVSGSYRSLVRGVSQQDPSARLDGQHEEQVNMVSDPVRGLTRRQGTLMLSESNLGVVPAVAADLAKFRTRDLTAGSDELTILYREHAAPVSNAAADFYVFDRATLQRYTATTDDSAALHTMLGGGISGITSVGRFVLLAGKTHVVTSSGSEVWDTPANESSAVLWVRGGAYSRPFKTVFRFRAGAWGAAYTVTLTHSTPSSAYSGTLDTSDIAASDPEYQKKVNDRVNAYNSAVTQWTATAAAAIQPDAIAEEIETLINANAGTTHMTVTRNGAHIAVVDPEGRLEGVTVDDGGDGTLYRAVHLEVDDAAKLTAQAIPGKVIRVKPNGETAWYVEAVPTSGSGTDLQTVRWQETSRFPVTVDTPFAVGTVEAGVFYVSPTIAGLVGLVPALTVPDFMPRASGDEDSNPVPYFVGRTITYLGTFQDRLVIGSGPVLNFSRVGDYFNFFKESALTVIDSDPVEAYAVGSEEDVIRRSVIFDKSLLLFGDKQQYAVSGRVPLTPSTSNVIQSSAHSDATEASPLVAGDLVFYAKSVGGSTQVYQIAVGDVEDTSNSTEVTQQLSTYIGGMPVEMVGVTMPDAILVRASAMPNSVYVFRYLDALGGQQRLLDSWSRWDFDESLGPVCGMSVYKGEVRFLFARSNTTLWVVADQASLLARDSTLPHLDSLRPSNHVDIATSPATADFQAALRTGVDGAMFGCDTLAEIPELLADFPTATAGDVYVGAPFSAYATLTSPYPRDRQGDVITTGRTTVTSLQVSYTHTGGFTVEVATPYGNTQSVKFIGRRVDAADNLVSVQPISRGTTPAFIGREVREYTATLKSLKWLPVTFTTVEWIGQYLNNTRRV